MYGHTHRAQSDSMTMALVKPAMAWGLGCLCDMAAPYLRGRPSNWTNQFAVVYLDEKTGNFTVYPITMANNEFVWNGKRYK